MADKNIREPPEAEELQDDSLLAVAQQGTAMKLTGKKLADFAREKGAEDVQRAVDAAGDAAKSAATAKEYSGKPPIIGEDENWQTWDAEAGAYTDTGKPSRGKTGPEGPQGKVGPQGPQGDTGKSFTILGYYDTYAALQEAVLEPSAGDAYGVGTEAPYDIYIYDAENGWVNNGPINVDLPAHLVIGEDSELPAAMPVDADTLQGHPAEYFASAAELAEKQDALPYYSNPNLLDNWYFANPVNQRGKTEYTGNGYTIDRWKLEDSQSSVSVTESGLKFDVKNLGVVRQLFDEDVRNYILNKTVTLSALSISGFASKTVKVTPSSTGNVDTEDLVLGEYNIDLYGNISDSYGLGFRIWCRAAEASETFIAFKLELGDTQTLAHKEGDTWVLNEIPDYGAELAKCQRYQEYIGYMIKQTYSNSFDDTILWKVCKRIPGTVNIYSEIGTAGKVSLWASNEWKDIDAIVSTSSTYGARVRVYGGIGNGDLISFKLFGDSNL